MTTTTGWAGPRDQLLAALPDWLTPEQAQLSAHVDRGCRVLTWTFPDRPDQPYTLFRNTFRMAWLDVVEAQMLGGDAKGLRLSATRVLPVGHWEREAFTDAAKIDLDAAILPAFAATGGFDALWGATHRAGHDHTSAADRALEAERIVAWWDRKAWLDFAYNENLLTLAPLPARDAHQVGRRREVPVAPGYRGNSNWPRAEVAARLMQECDCLACQAGDLLDSHQVGWLTDGGDIIPLAAILEVPNASHD